MTNATGRRCYKLVCKPVGQPFRSICGTKPANYFWSADEEYAPYLIYELKHITEAPPTTVGCFCFKTIEAVEKFAAVVKEWPIYVHPLYVVRVIGYEEQQSLPWFSTTLYFDSSRMNPITLPKARLVPGVTETTNDHMPLKDSIIFRRVRVTSIVKEL